MNKADLVDSIKDQFDSKSEAEKAVAAVVDGLKKGIMKDSKVQLVGFGTFLVRERKARMGRNPQTGKKIKIKASKTVAFRPGKAFKASL